MAHDAAAGVAMADVAGTERGAGPYRRLWRLAWPVSVSTSTVTLLTLVNLFWISRLGTEAVAAVSVCGQILFIAVALGACYQASGDTRTPMLVNVVVVTLNGLIDPFFIERRG